jgi:hypothetical protein
MWLDHLLIELKLFGLAVLEQLRRDWWLILLLIFGLLVWLSSMQIRF